MTHSFFPKTTKLETAIYNGLSYALYSLQQGTHKPNTQVLTPFDAEFQKNISKWQEKHNTHKIPPEDVWVASVAYLVREALGHTTHFLVPKNVLFDFDKPPETLILKRDNKKKSIAIPHMTARLSTILRGQNPSELIASECVFIHHDSEDNFQETARTCLIQNCTQHIPWFFASAWDGTTFQSLIENTGIAGHLWASGTTLAETPGTTQPETPPKEIVLTKCSILDTLGPFLRHLNVVLNDNLASTLAKTKPADMYLLMNQMWVVGFECHAIYAQKLDTQGKDNQIRNFLSNKTNIFDKEGVHISLNEDTNNEYKIERSLLSVENKNTVRDIFNLNLTDKIDTMNKMNGGGTLAIVQLTNEAVFRWVKGPTEIEVFINKDGAWQKTPEDHVVNHSEEPDQELHVNLDDSMEKIIRRMKMLHDTVKKMENIN